MSAVIYGVIASILATHLNSSRLSGKVMFLDLHTFRISDSIDCSKKNNSGAPEPFLVGRCFPLDVLICWNFTRSCVTPFLQYLIWTYCMQTCPLYPVPENVAQLSFCNMTFSVHFTMESMNFDGSRVKPIRCH